MCGIVGYVGDRQCRNLVLKGLTRLEYRGYDSAGFVCIDQNNNNLSFHKEAGGSSPLERLSNAVTFDGTIGMGHTRWATHGIVDQANAHPHFNCAKSLAVIHNGIVEGYEGLREELIKRNHNFYSSTDTEVVAHYFSDLLKQHSFDLKQALLALTASLKGAYAFVFIVKEFPDQLIVVRHRSPLAIGIGNNEMFVASDFLAFSDQTNNVVFMPDDSFALIKKNGIELYNFNGESLAVVSQSVDAIALDNDKLGFEHYMLKEIYDQKLAIGRTISFYQAICTCNESGQPISDVYRSSYLSNEYSDAIWRQLGLSKEKIKNLKTIHLIAAGTSWHASRIAQFFFETIARIPTRVHLASEFRYMPLFVEQDNLYIMVSQSGETADTLEALRLINSFEMPTVALTNVATSSMVREAGGFLPMQAGPEIAVASTKAFSTQLATLYWVANRIALERGDINKEQMRTAEEDLFVVAEVLESTIEAYKYVITQDLAKFYAQFERFIFLGRHISYPFALEAALKLKEISYIFSQCYPAGELKHGPIALVDEKTPVVMFSVMDDLIYRKLVSNAHEVKARKGHLVVFAFEGQSELINLGDCVFIIPKVAPLLAPLAMTGVMQFLVYHITRVLGRPIDKPRNLAKSVTVE
ncbi:MAG: glutamine--fructose-6-phosphate transaminase (isomerizing) [Candidatus Babeliales bacterium]